MSKLTGYIKQFFKISRLLILAQKSLFKFEELHIQVSVQSDEYMFCKIVEVGENVYLPSHINVFWLARADSITSSLRFSGLTWIGTASFMLQLLHSLFFVGIPCFSDTTGLLVPETNL